MDNEPWPLWDGDDEAERIAAWAEEWFDERLGVVAPAERLNGSSGRWLRDQVLGPLGARPDDVWITDCLDTYRASQGQLRRIADTYDPVARELGLPTAQLGDHPSEDQIVREALDTQRQRLLRELEFVTPDVIVTLGRAAARVLHDLLELDGRAERSKDEYGEFAHVVCQDRPVQWLALAHRGAPSEWQAIHQQWVAAQTRSDERDSQTGDGPPRWLPQRLLAAGADAPGVLAEYVSQRLVSGALERARRRRTKHPDAHPDELVKRAAGSYVRLAHPRGRSLA